MKTLQFTRTLALTGLALTPMAWLVSGCGGGGGGGSNNNNGTPRPTNTPRPTATTRPTTTATTTATASPSATTTATTVPTRTATPIPTPFVPTGGRRILANIDLGAGQTGILNLVVSLSGIKGLITVAPIPANKVGIFQVQPGTYAVSGTFSLTNNTFQFGGKLLLVSGNEIAFSANGRVGTPNTITVTVGNTTFPTQNF